MLEAKLFDEKDCVMRGQLITKTAEETAAFLLNHCDGDNQRLTVLMAKFAADAVFDQNRRAPLLGLRPRALQERLSRRNSAARAPVLAGPLEDAEH